MAEYVYYSHTSDEIISATEWTHKLFLDTSPFPGWHYIGEL